MPTPRAFEDYVDGCYSILLLPHSPLIIYRLELRDLVENRETSSALTLIKRVASGIYMWGIHVCVVSYCFGIRPLNRDGENTRGFTL